MCASQIQKKRYVKRAKYQPSNLALNLAKTNRSPPTHYPGKTFETLIKRIHMLLCTAQQRHPTFLAVSFILQNLLLENLFRPLLDS